MVNIWNIRIVPQRARRRVPIKTWKYHAKRNVLQAALASMVMYSTNTGIAFRNSPVL